MSRKSRKKAPRKRGATKRGKAKVDPAPKRKAVSDSSGERPQKIPKAEPKPVAKSFPSEPTAQRPLKRPVDPESESESEAAPMPRRRLRRLRCSSDSDSDDYVVSHIVEQHEAGRPLVLKQNGSDLKDLQQGCSNQFYR